MKQVLCAADALVKFRASMVSALLCAAALSMPVSAAPASNPPAENNSGLEEIVVTAEKRESTVQATPIAMTALSAGDLTEQHYRGPGHLGIVFGIIPGFPPGPAEGPSTQTPMK